MEALTFLRPYTWPAVICALVTLAAYIYHRLFPTPHPGLPHDPASTRLIFGDARHLAAAAGEPSKAMAGIVQRAASPFAQLLFTSFAARPVILLSDPREAEDILVRRNREFDRSPFTAGYFSALLPACTIAQMTTPALKAQKRLWGDVMTVDFLRRVVAPNIRAAALELVELWRVRAGDGEAEPFEVFEDFRHAALDAIWVAVLGSELGTVRRDIRARRGDAGAISAEEMQKAASGAVIQEAFEYINATVEAGVGSLWPEFSMWWVQSSAHFRRVKRIADAEVQRLMAAACERFARVSGAGEAEGSKQDTCAMDLVLRREVAAAQKAGRPVTDAVKDPAMLQELLLLLIAGFESTSNTLSWFVGYAGMHQAAQSELRRALETAFSGSKAPSAAEIIETDIPYLDAYMEETLRMSCAAHLIARKAVVDTEILGCQIPAGSNIVITTRLEQPVVDVPENLRSPTSRAAQEKRVRGGLDGESGRDLDTFEPRRWLYKDDAGKDVFDPTSLPILVFGGGFRGCFGKRLAIQELRIMMTLLVLNFEFQALPTELLSMDGVEKLFRRPKMAHAKLRPL